MIIAIKGKRKYHYVQLFITVFLWPLFFSCNAQTNSSPVFEPAKGSPIAMTCSPGNIVAGDINNDGRPDLVVACAQNRRITLFTGKGNGEFEAFTGNQL